MEKLDCRIYHAAGSGHEFEFKILLKKNNYDFEQEMSILNLVVLNGHFHLMIWLLHFLPFIDCYDRILFYACEGQQVEIVKWYLKTFPIVNFNYCNEVYETIIDIGIWNIDILKELIYYGATFNHKQIELCPIIDLLPIESLWKYLTINPKQDIINKFNDDQTLKLYYLAAQHGSIKIANKLKNINCYLNVLKFALINSKIKFFKWFIIKFNIVKSEIKLSIEISQCFNSFADLIWILKNFHVQNHEIVKKSILLKNEQCLKKALTLSNIEYGNYNYQNLIIDVNWLKGMILLCNCLSSKQIGDAMCYCINKNCFSILEWFLQQGYINNETSNNHSILGYAIYIEDVHAMELLYSYWEISSDDDNDKKETIYYSWLCDTCNLNKRTSFKWLFKKRNYKKESLDLFHNAIVRNHIEIASFLISTSPSLIFERDKIGYHSFYVAIEHSFTIFKLLMKSTDTAICANSLLLDHACKVGKLEIVKWIYANTNCTISMRSVDLAIYNNQEFILEWMVIDHNIFHKGLLKMAIDQHQNTRAKKLLKTAINQYQNDKKETKTNKKDIDMDIFHIPVVEIAIRSNNEEILEFVSHYVDINITKFIVRIAIECNRTNIIRWLLTKKYINLNPNDVVDIFKSAINSGNTKSLYLFFLGGFKSLQYSTNIQEQTIFTRAFLKAFRKSTTILNPPLLKIICEFLDSYENIRK